MSDEESVGDWVPPPVVQIVESEVLQIPSGLPSIDEFVRLELEKEALEAAEAEAAKLKEAEEAEVVVEAEAEVAVEAPPEEGSVGEPAGVEDETGGAVEEQVSDDEYEMPEAEVKKPKKPVKKIADDWYDMDTVKIDFGDVKYSMEQQAKEELRLRLISSTHDYIDGIINRVVEMCEYEDPDEILRTRLNKTKISRELDEKLLQLDIEQKVRFFLNRKTVEYFRRKKAMRPLTDDAPDVVLNELRKYREGLQMVNRYKGREETTRHLMEAKTAELQEQLATLQTQETALSKEFANMVRKVFADESEPNMDVIIESLLHKVKSMRAEISKVRFTLIQRQHTIATLQEKAKKLEDLGNGLRMADFEHLQTETQALGKKIEERNNELNRLHARCNADIHTLAHIREKQHMLRHTIVAQEAAYNEFIGEKQNCREYLNRLKIERGAIRREFQKISFQNGLLDKPDLLLDFDATEAKTNILRTKNNEVKTAQLVVDNKLKQMMRQMQ